MAKAKAKKAPAKEPKAEAQSKLLDPKALHEMLGITGPWDPPPEPPIPSKGFVTWWDCGMSINTLAKKKPELFYMPRLFEGERCAKDTDSWKWREFRLEPIAPELPFEEQRKQLKTGEEPATARELVMFLSLHFLLKGERLDLGRLRTKDRAESGQRMTVWFSPRGFDLASVSDSWRSPGIGLSVMMTPVMHRKK